MKNEKQNNQALLQNLINDNDNIVDSNHNIPLLRGRGLCTVDYIKLAVALCGNQPTKTLSKFRRSLFDEATGKGTWRTRFDKSMALQCAVAIWGEDGHTAFHAYCNEAGLVSA